MITAKQARDKIEASLKPKMVAELALIEEKINKAIECGEFNIEAEILYDISRNKLQNLGYSVNFKRDKIHNIRW